MPLIFVFVFLEPLPSLPVSVGYTNLLCWLPDPILFPTQMPGKNSVQLLSLWTHLPPPGATATPGNGCSQPASAQAQHPPRTVGNPTPSAFIHQHLHRSLKQPAIVRARDKDDSAFCRHLKCEIGMIFSHM